MLPLQLSWMPFSSELFFVGCSKSAFSCNLYLDSSAARGVLSRRGVGRLRHLSCRVLWLQNLVVEKMLQVKAVFGNNQSSRCFNKRLSIAQAGIIDVSLWALEQFTKPTGGIRRPRKNLQTRSTAICINFKVAIHNFEFGRRLELADPSTSRV